ncbi:TPA: glycosyltransferase family 2 protein [Shewanella algae]|uniref:glycosyltransferase n=1 Tax=Shewanella algae TaxID=38313 RepID=UPI001C561056|nr:glycosyltransferase family 2 protein [Shewanella algae]HDS1207143.1 glycosyltransferase family 2 protein [Shewanella algae]
MKNKISVIVCAYNEEANIVNCINSLFAQTLANEYFEVIICDNSSTDNTYLLASNLITSSNKFNYKVIKIKHVDLSTSRNTALKYASGDYVTYFDADAKIDKNALLNLSKLIDDDTVDVVSGSVLNLNSNTKISNFFYNCHVKASIDASSGSKLVGANMTFKRSLLNRVKFLKGMKRGDETSLLVRLKAAIPTLNEVHAPDVVVYNDYPVKIYSWLKIMYTEGAMRFIIDSQFESQSRLVIVSKVFMRTSYIISCFVLFCNLFINLGVEINSIAFLSILIRLNRALIYFKHSFINVSKGVFAPLNVIMSLFTGCIFFALRDVGYISNFIKYYYSCPELTEEVSTVIDSVENYNET